MTALPSSGIDGDDVSGTRLRLLDVVVVGGSAGARFFDEVKEVLVRRSQTVPFRSRDRVGLAPYQVVPEDPTALLHCNGEARRNQEQILLLANATQRCLSSMPVFT